MDEQTLQLLYSLGDLIKVVGIIGGGIFAGYTTFKTLFVKQFQKQLSGITEVLEVIQVENTQQNNNIQLLLTQQEIIMGTDRDMLRAMITAKYYQYKDKEFFPIYERECLSLIYSDYKALHGNSFIDSLYHELLEIPSCI